jgi:hypothetical protein
MKSNTLLIIVIGSVLVAAGALKWRLNRKAAVRQALLDEAAQNSASLYAFAEREYGSLGTTTDEIFNHEDSKILGALNYRIGQKAVARITEPELRLLAVYCLWGEVHNGGFDQYFFNSSGNDSEAALAGLKELGAPAAAALLERAMYAFPGGKPPADRKQRVALMAKLRKKAEGVWEQCDKEFYALKEDLSQLMLTYAKQKRDEIVLP